MAEKNLYYFVSDVHLGLDYLNPEERERKFARFLMQLPPQTKKLFLLGDIFDFWYEYKKVIPRGFTRTLGALAALVDDAFIASQGIMPHMSQLLYGKPSRVSVFRPTEKTNQ